MSDKKPQYSLLTLCIVVLLAGVVLFANLRCNLTTLIAVDFIAAGALVICLLLLLFQDKVKKQMQTSASSGVLAEALVFAFILAGLAVLILLRRR